MRSKMSASKSRMKVAGRGVKLDFAKTLRDLPSTPDSEANGHVQGPDDDDFESPAPTKKSQQESSRMTRSQTKNTPTLVNIVRIRSKKCGRHEKFKEKLKFDLVDEDNVGPSVKLKKRKIEDFKHKKSKIEDDGESGLDCISKEQRIATHRKFKERTAKLKLNYRNISPTREEMSTQNIATLFEVNADDVASGEVPAFHTDNSVSESPPYPQNMEQQSKRPYPQNTEQQPKPSYDPSAHIDQLNAEVEKLRSVVGKLTYTVMTLNGYVVSYFEKVFSFLNMKETKQTREEVPDTKIRQCVSDDNTSGLGEYNGYRYDVVPDFVEQMNQDNTLADQTNLGVKAIEGVTDGVDHGAAGRCQG
nr:uncharacterized protein LOC104092745 isoform X4 [Nicotiana tomentosiformis]